MTYLLPVLNKTQVVPYLFHVQFFKRFPRFSIKVIHEEKISLLLLTFQQERQKVKHLTIQVYACGF